ncbi:MAG: DUF1343 domain-containing protein [Chitinophagaceae bacterium]|nr:DUF1343 domain-containing protein [Chitinophagaceae bacterium]
MQKIFFFLTIAFVSFSCKSQTSPEVKTAEAKIITGAERMDVYLPFVEGKSVGLLVNNTSMVGNSHLVDTLMKLGVNIKVIFGPEHGFRGTASAGEKVGNYIDEETGIPVVSLYGSKRRPAPEDVENVDIMIYDIQDVGVRFYTYISSMQEFMEAAFEYGKPLIILDRPNPNGFYVDGPVLQKEFSSFVGMQPIPIVYGMTIGEYATMLAGEKWLKDKANEKFATFDSNQQPGDFTFLIVKNKNYDHTLKYILPEKPSPNLPEIQSIYLYPSTCLFEGTSLSEGRGTDKPFQIFGSPELPHNLYAFTPTSRPGAVSSKHYDKVCYGWNLSGTPEEVLKKVDNKIQLKWIIEAYKLFPEKDKFFLMPKSGDMKGSFFSKLAGNNELWQQIRNGVPEEDIRASWQPALDQFKQIRKKYLLYKDFE